MLKSTNKFGAYVCHATVCAQCGYRFVGGDEGYRVKETGDVIHRECWMDYSDDFVGEMCEEIDF